MCGIAGLSLSSSQQAKAALVQPLADALAHRGPDGEGLFVSANMALAHRRLSIIDVAGGQQPFVEGETGAEIALIANGEVYNYKDLTRRAQESGATLRTHSDCEPLLHRYLQIGDAAFDELGGMYACALADVREGTLCLAIDPFGIKPLYYAETTVGFAFASEPKALLAAGWVRPDVNPNALGGVLNRHYSTGAETLFKGIFRLLPGERLVVKDGKIIHRWRKLPPLAAARPESDASMLTARFGAEFQAAVARHLQADVPYGLLLSGGLDSSAVAVAMRALGAPLHTYTAVIDVPGGPNEAEHAAALARKLGATHTTVTYGAADFWNGLVDMAWAMDDVVTDYAALPLLKLTNRAREDVKILLSGEGGDELLGGYSAYRKAASPQSLLKQAKGWWKSRRDGDATPFAAAFLKGAPVRCPSAVVQPWDKTGLTPLQIRQGQDVAGWLPSDLLLKLDRTTMTNGIEGRVPFLDDTFAAYAFSLPDSAKVDAQFGKKVLRKHLESQGLGDMAWARKQGFSVQVGVFLEQRKEAVARLWQTDPLLQSLLSAQAPRVLLGNLGHAKTANLSLSLTLLGLWNQMHILRRPQDEVRSLLLPTP